MTGGVVLAAAVAAALLAGCANGKSGAIETLECLERFKMDRFPVACWAWGGPFDDRYCKELREAGFNTILGHPDAMTARMAERHGYKVMLGTGPHLPNAQKVHREYGRRPFVMGYHLDDNCQLHGYTVKTAEWLSESAPDKVAWLSSNPNPVAQAKAPMPIITTQIYPFAETNSLPDDQLRRVFANQCERDRAHANRYNMAAMPFIAAYAHCETPSQYRFQANTAVAYGAKGFWIFAYNRYFRLALNRAAGPANHYIANIVGPITFSRRSVGVFHTGPEYPGDCERPGAGKLITKMDVGLLAGVFVPDADFQAGIDAPDYVMVVDKRTIKFDGGLGRWSGGHSDREARPKWVTELVDRLYREDDATSRRAKITFGERVEAVDALLPDGSVTRYPRTPGAAIELPPLRGGEAILLRIRAKVRRVDPASKAAVLTLPSKWKFSLDTQQLAENQKWYAPEFDDRGWKEIRVDKDAGWRDQGYGNYKGPGWYRLRLTVPPELRKKHLYLHFGAADEESWVYIDGVLAFEHTRRSAKVGLVEIWTMPFFFDCAKLLGNEKEHTLAVRVHNFYGAGGLYRPVNLVGSDEPLDRDQIWRAIQKHRGEK